MNKEEIENNRIPKEIAKALGIEKEDKDSLMAFKENLYEQTARENVRLKKELEQKEYILDKVTEKLKEDIKNDYCIKEIIGDSYIAVGVKECSVKPYARELLNIIEGGNIKND